MEIKAGTNIFYLNHSAWNPNDKEVLVLECSVTEVGDRLIARAIKEGEYASFDINTIKQHAYLNDYIFPTREAALEKYNEGLDQYISVINNKPKQELLQNLYRGWVGESILDERVLQAMKDKIEKEFGVKVD